MKHRVSQQTDDKVRDIEYKSRRCLQTLRTTLEYAQVLSLTTLQTPTKNMLQNWTAQARTQKSKKLHETHF